MYSRAWRNAYEVTGRVGYYLVPRTKKRMGDN
jgi:hypothetical protein